MFRILFLLLLNGPLFFTYAQADSLQVKNQIGFMIGSGTQKNFPLASNDYIYDSFSIRLQYERHLWSSRKWGYSLIAQPGFFRVDHQLLNQFFVKPSTPNFIEMRNRFLQPRTFEEYVLNLGFKVTFDVIENLGFYAVGSTGPMYSTESTERLKGGFAFSNLLGLGAHYRIFGNLRLDGRVSIRHNSNAGLRKPNSGHNSLLLESGLSYGF